MQLPSETLLQGGKYRIIEKIGQGGFGVTYKAEDTALERIVAIKEFFFAANCERQTGTNQVTFSANNNELVTKLKRKFLNEAKRLAKFNHHSIVNIFDVFEENGTAYFSMEYIKSGSLEDLVRNSGKLPELKALVYIQQLGEVLHYLHTRQTCHLDIKPANVLLDENGRIKLIDFGLSKQYEINTAHTTTLLAISKGYAPIEQYSQGGISDFSPTADIYSLGATLYFLLKGEAPPEAIQLAVSILPKIKNVSDVTNAAILHAMMANSKERPQTVTEWLARFDKPGMAIKIPIEDTEILQPKVFYYDDVLNFSDGLAGVMPKGIFGFSNGKCGFIDKFGKQVIPCIYDNTWGFSEGLASVEQNGKWGCINKSGNIIIPIVYDNVDIFHEGLASVRRNGKCGFIDKFGKHVIPVVYDFAGIFSEGLAWVRKKNEQWICINRTGKKVIPFGFSLAGYFRDGLAVAKKGNYSLLDLVRMRPLNGKWGFINKSGKNVIPYDYDEAAGFQEGLASVEQNGKYGFIDKTGQLIIPFLYNDARDFSEGLASVEQNGKWGFINKKGRQIIPIIYDKASDFSEELAWVSQNGKYGFIDQRGKQVIPFIYDDAKIFSEGLAGVVQNGKWGFIDKMGRGI